MTWFTTPAFLDGIDSSLVQDRFGIRKLILLTTRVGKVFAIRSDVGEVVWARSFGRGLGGGGKNKPILQKLIPVRSVAVQVPPVVVYVSVDAKGTHVSRLNALTGALLNETATTSPDQQSYPFQATKILKVPVVDSASHTDVVAIVNPSLQVQLYPNTVETMAAASQHLSGLYFTLGGNIEDDFIAGYSMVSSGKVLT